jgi:hypothetical protein
MITTIKIEKETKERLLSIDLAEKGKTFDMIVNDLVTFYQKSNKKYTDDYKEWEKSMKVYKKNVKEYDEDVKEYNKQKKVWIKLLKWAKTKGFKE